VENVNMGELLVTRQARFGDRMLPILNALRISQKTGFQINCIWVDTDELRWKNIFHPSLDWNDEIFRNFNVSHYQTNNKSLVPNGVNETIKSVISKSTIPKCKIYFDDEYGHYVHRLPSKFELSKHNVIHHISNPVGIYLLHDENLFEVISEISKIFYKLPFKDNIKNGFKIIDKKLKKIGVNDENSISIHIRRGDVINFAKTDGKALIERIVPIYEYEQRIELLTKSMDLNFILVASDDPKISNKINISNPKVTKLVLNNLISKEDYSEIEFDIMDLYFLSRSSRISAGYSAFAILSAVITKGNLYRLDMNQDLPRRLDNIYDEIKDNDGNISEDWKLGFSTAYSVSIDKLLSSGNIEEGHKLAKKMATFFPNNAEVFYILGNIANRRKDYKNAIKFHKKSVFISPTNSHYQLALSHALFESKMLIESKITAELSFFLMPNNQNTIRHLIKIYSTLKNYNAVLFSLLYQSYLKSSIGIYYDQIISTISKIQDSNTGLSFYEDGIFDLINSYNSNDSNDIEIINSIRALLLSNGSIFSTNIDDKINESIEKNPLRNFLLSELDKNKDSDKKLKFSTERFFNGNRAFIGGLADRIKGASTTMLLSIILGRKFELEWLHPEDINNIFVPKGYDWRQKDTSQEFKKIDLIDINFSKELRTRLSENVMEDILNIHNENAILYCNSIELGYSQNVNYNFHKFNLFEKLNRRQLVGTFSSLLEYRPGLEESMMLMVFQNYIAEFDCCIAIHFRTGGDGGWRDPKMDQNENIEKLISRAIKIIDDLEGNCCIYLACDSSSLKKSIISKYSDSLNIFSINIPLAHVDRSSDADAIMGSRYAVMENMMITLSNHILMGRGGFAELSANRLFIEPWRYYDN